jgi:hypothetical protein
MDFSPLFTCRIVEHPTKKKKRKKKKGKGKDAELQLLTVLVLVVLLSRQAVVPGGGFSFFLFGFSPGSPVFFLWFFSRSQTILLPLSALSSPVFIGKKQGERGILPLPNRATRVGWLGRPLCSRHRTVKGAHPLCFFILL